ncbi:MAG TPA: hypothetical protein PLR52_04400 [Bacteroidales bacterium]|nr:hypothetical protein [Bacteroidales bacterium]HPI68644.1 hypothetical protein [Bacteroidales bacterium]
MPNIPQPLIFNPLKHHLIYIRDFIAERLRDNNDFYHENFVRELRYIGSSVMDVYNGSLGVRQICDEVISIIRSLNIIEQDTFRKWAGYDHRKYKSITLSDKSRWIVQYNDDTFRFIHLFPARLSPHTFRIKANTLKSAIIYYLIIGKDFIAREDLNYARSLIGLSAVKDPEECEAITKMIDIIRF